MTRHFKTDLRPGQADTAQQEALALQGLCFDLGAALAQHGFWTEPSELKAVAEQITDTYHNTLPLEMLSRDEVQLATGLYPDDIAADAIQKGFSGRWNKPEAA